MEKKITPQEEEKANKIKLEFSQVHQEISLIQSEMNSLNQKAEELIQKLESLRKEEFDFMEILKENYGEGKLDPFKMTYETRE